MGKITMEELKQWIREVPDYPKPGINFYDITTLLKNPEGLCLTLKSLSDTFAGEKVDKVIGIESRGFLFAPHLACELGAGFIPVRKPGKLPAETVSSSYELEYGVDTLEMHVDAVQEGDRVLIIDDVIATGGTAKATGDLVRSCGGEVAGYGFVIELTFLDGRSKLDGADVRALVAY